MFEAKTGKVYLDTNSVNIVPTVVPLVPDSMLPSNFVSVNEYMMMVVDSSDHDPSPDLGTKCKSCRMFERREIESDLTVILELDYNDILEVILEQDP